MKEYKSILNFHTTSDYHLCSPMIKDRQRSDIEIEDIQKAEAFLAKYWLPETEYHQKWKPIQDTIFCNLQSTLPAMVFKDDFELFASTSGCLFAKNDFEKFRDYLISIEETSFVVIQHCYESTDIEPLFRMKFPSTITWEEMMNGDFISIILCGFSRGAYRVFGNNGDWAKFTDNDYEMPFDIYAYKVGNQKKFDKVFQETEHWKSLTYKFLPQLYKDRIALQNGEADIFKFIAIS